MGKYYSCRYCFPAQPPSSNLNKLEPKKTGTAGQAQAAVSLCPLYLPALFRLSVTLRLPVPLLLIIYPFLQQLVQLCLVKITAPYKDLPLQLVHMILSCISVLAYSPAYSLSLSLLACHLICWLSDARCGPGRRGFGAEVHRGVIGGSSEPRPQRATDAHGRRQNRHISVLPSSSLKRPLSLYRLPLSPSLFG